MESSAIRILRHGLRHYISLEEMVCPECHDTDSYLEWEFLEEEDCYECICPMCGCIFQIGDFRGREETKKATGTVPDRTSMEYAYEVELECDGDEEEEDETEEYEDEEEQPEQQEERANTA